MADFLPTVSELILEFLKTTLQEAWGISSYYYGDPGEFPIGSLPAVCVVKQQADVTQDSTQRDDMASTYVVRLVLNKEEDFNADPGSDLTQKKLEQIVEGRDYTTGYYISSTIMGCLRQNFTLGNRLVGNHAKIRYVLDPRGQNLYAEAEITFTLDERIILQGART